MSKVISLTDKFDLVKPVIELSGKSYEVDDSMGAVIKFQELSEHSDDIGVMKEAVAIALGKEAVEELKLDKLSLKNFKVLMIAIMASMQGITYEEAEGRFRNQE